MTRKLLRVLLCVVLLLTSITPPPTTAWRRLDKLEQQINIVVGEYTTSSQTYSPSDNSLGLVNYTAANYTSPVVYFEAVVRCSDCDPGDTASAALYSDSGTQISTLTTSTENSYQLLRSGSIALSDDDYTVRFRLNQANGTALLKAARLVIVQSESPITNTQTQIELGPNNNNLAVTNTNATGYTDPKYYLFDNSHFSGTVTAQLEATIRITGTTKTAAYYFDDYHGTDQWSTNPTNLTDGSTATYASTSDDADLMRVTSNTNTATDLGRITKVELRLFAYQTDSTTGQVGITPVFSGGDGDTYDFTPAETTGAWSTYYDITDSTNAPGSGNWDWQDVADLEAELVWNRANSSNTVFASQLDVRVTYEDNTIYGTVELYNRTTASVVASSSITTSSATWERVRSSAFTTNWNTSAANEYQIRVRTSDGGNSVYLANAKVVLTQTQAEGLQRVETIQHHLTTLRTQNTTSYTQESFITSFNPDNFSGTVVRAFYEATLRTSVEDSAVTAALYNTSIGDIINDPIDSQASTSSDTYMRIRSSNLGRNSDWPSSTTSFTTILKTSEATTTAYVANSWIIIQAAVVDPAVTISISGVDLDTSTNGVTTSVTTTATAISFGNLTLNQPKYAAHQINVTTNEASIGYSGYVRLDYVMQGDYPANVISRFGGDSAVWGSPVAWYSPTGTTPNIQTAWVGANTSDSDVPGWTGDTSGKFGPLDTQDVRVLYANSPDVSESEYVTFAIEANINQPADSYSSLIIYTFVPEF